MALDEAIMDAVAAGDGRPTLRLYQWSPPCLSLGRRQPQNGVDFDRCERDGVDVVRRATGGLAILHTDELTYSIATTPDDPRAAGAILDAYRSLSEGLVAGLHLLGVPVEMSSATPGAAHNASAVCFEAPSAYEIVAGGRKLLGSAQVRPQGRVMQHGSLPLRGDIGRIVDYLRFESEDERESLREHLRQRAVTLDAALGRAISFDEAAEALIRGFATALNLEWEACSPSDGELDAAKRQVGEKRVRAAA
jgi:lipoate-protein ligase A